MQGLQLSAARIAGMVAGRLVGDPDAAVTGVEALEEASGTDASFLGNPKYRGQVLPSKAAVVLVPEDYDISPPAGRAWIVCKDASAAFSRLVAAFAPPPVVPVPGIHGTAVVSPDASIGSAVSIAAHAVVEAGARIGDRSVIGAGCYIGHEARIGEDCLIHPNVTIRERCVLGNRVGIHSGTVIGSDGFGYIPGAERHEKIPQVGIVQIDDDVEIGAQVAIDRARFGKTWIKRGAKIDNLVQIAHNVVIGELCFIIAQVGISGSTRLGRGVIAAGQAGLAGHLNIGDGVTMMAKAGVSKDLAPGEVVVGIPAVPRKEFARNLFEINSIAKLKASVKELRKQVADLQAGGTGKG